MFVFWGIIIPFIGTSVGAVFVYFFKKNLNESIHVLLLSLAAGVMIAASIWSLILPAIESSETMGKLAFVPAAVGFLLGFLILIVIDRIVTQLGNRMDTQMSKKGRQLLDISKETMLLAIAVTLHNIPEGMAVGVAFAGLIEGNPNLSPSAAMITAVGIAIQNIPEGAVISMPLLKSGYSKNKSFLFGIISGVVEPVAGALTLLLCSLVSKFLPYLLAFAAGAMMFVVIKELVPKASKDDKSYVCAIGYAIGFLIMMSLDVALG